MPEIKIPEVNLPELHRPDVHLPEFDWPGLKKLDLKAPEVHLPDFTPPKFDMPSFELPDLATLKRFGRPAPRRTSLWPWAVVAGIAAVFAGWWLATSSVTGPKVRRLAGQARERIEDLRNGRSHMEAEDEEAAAAGWTSEPAWQASAETPPTRDRSSAAP